MTPTNTTELRTLRPFQSVIGRTIMSGAVIKLTTEQFMEPKFQDWFQLCVLPRLLPGERKLVQLEFVKENEKDV